MVFKLPRPTSEIHWVKFIIIFAKSKITQYQFIKICNNCGNEYRCRGQKLWELQRFDWKSPFTSNDIFI